MIRFSDEVVQAPLAPATSKSLKWVRSVAGRRQCDVADVVSYVNERVVGDIG